MRTPDDDSWGNWQSDLDVANAYGVLHGKTREEVKRLFAENPIEIAESLRFAPCQVTSYYLLGCLDYLESEASRGNADAASSLLRVVIDKLQTCSRHAFAPTEKIVDSLRVVSQRQSYYEADPQVYGSFSKLFSELKTLLEQA